MPTSQNDAVLAIIAIGKIILSANNFEEIISSQHPDINP